VADIFHEIDEELKRDKALELWRRHGKYVIAFFVAAVLVTAGTVAWQGHQETQRQAEARSFALAMEQVAQKNVPASTALLAELAGRSGGYRVLALLQEASLKTKAGDRAGAAAIYDQLAADGDAEKPFRDLATMLSALVGFDRADPVALDKKLAPLAAEGSAFRPSALELRGLIAIKRGDFKAAKSYFQAIADDAAAPGGLRQRATQILAWVGERGGA
jgi:hypothetical protein